LFSERIVILIFASFWKSTAANEQISVAFFGHDQHFGKNMLDEILLDVEEDVLQEF